MAAAFMAAAGSTGEAASTGAEDISVASAAVVSTLVASGPHPPFMAAAIVTAEFATMAEADSIATASIVPPITAIAISTGATMAAPIPITAIRAAAGSSGPITARAASAAGIAGTIRIAIGKH